MRKLVIVAGIALVLAGLTPQQAGAQTFLTVNGGSTAGGDTPTGKFTTGASLTFLGAMAGFEVDLGYTPDFFNQQNEFVVIADSNVTTLMGNILVGPRLTRVQPYGVIGLGLLRSRIDADDLFDAVSTNDFGFNAGFGLIGMVSERVGLRFDARYFRSFEDPSNDDDLDVSVGNFDFWRITGGVAFKF